MTVARKLGMDAEVRGAIQGHAPRTEGEEYGEVPPDVMLPDILKYSRYKIVAAERAALEFGCMLSINPDAHSIPELDHMRWGVAITRRGGCFRRPGPRAMTLPEITRYLHQKRRSFARAA
jgi:hypothetical protein